MNILKLLGKVGGSIIKSVVPGGSMVIDVVNGFLPAGSKLSENATGQQVQDAISDLPAEDRAMVLAKEIDEESRDV